MAIWVKIINNVNLYRRSAAQLDTGIYKDKFLNFNNYSHFLTFKFVIPEYESLLDPPPQDERN